MFGDIVIYIYQLLLRLIGVVFVSWCAEKSIWSPNDDGENGLISENPPFSSIMVSFLNSNLGISE